MKNITLHADSIRMSYISYLKDKAKIEFIVTRFDRLIISPSIRLPTTF